MARPRRPISEQDHVAMVRDYLAGLSLKNASRPHGFTQRACERALRLAGVPRRSVSEGHRIYKLDESYFDVIDCPDKAAILGFILADGCLCQGRISVRIQAGDREYLEKIRVRLSSSRPLAYHPATRLGGPQCGLVIQSPRMFSSLERYNLTPRKSLTAIPWNAPPELAPAYWLGVIDGDGHWSRDARHGTWNMGLVGSEAVVQGFADFVERVTGRQRTPRKRGKIFRTDYSGLEVLQHLAAELYSTGAICLERKRRRVEELLATKRQRVRWDNQVTPGQLVELYRRHGSWRAVARILGTSDQQVINFRRRWGLPINPYSSNHLVTEQGRR